MSSSVKKDTINKHLRGLPHRRARAAACARWADLLRSAAVAAAGLAPQTQACSNRVHVISGGRGARLHGDHTKKKKQHNQKTRKNKNE